MLERAESKPAKLSLRATRVAVSAFYGVSRLMRRPPAPPAGVVEHAYGADPAERLEYIAPRTGTQPRPAIVFVHGGGWILGKKEAYTRYLSFLAEAGYPVFNLEYPLAPETPHPGILRSLFKALDWIAQEYPGIGPVHFMGDSAGANLAMMLGLLGKNPGLVSDVEATRTGGLALECASVISLYGVLDRHSWIEDGFPGAENMLESYAGRAAFAETVPADLAITPLDLDFSEIPPCLLTVGTKDPLLRSSRIFAERLAEASSGVPVVLREYEGEGHGFFNLGRSASDREMNAEILRFLESVSVPEE